MTIRKKRSTRAALRSPGRPPVAGRAEQQRFWQAIAAGLSSEDAALKAEVSPCRTQIVPKGRRHATRDFQILGQAAFWAVPLVGGARGARTSQCAGAFHTGDGAPPRTG